MDGKAVYPVTPRMHVLERARRVAAAKADREAAVAEISRRMGRERAEDFAERYLVTKDDPRAPVVRKAILTARRKGLDVGNPTVSRRIANDTLRALERLEVRETTDVVYYLRVGDLIKIGTAADLKRRLRAYPPNTEVLATETGSYIRETERVEQFAEYLAGRREWFHPGPRLMAHIDSLRTGESA